MRYTVTFETLQPRAAAIDPRPKRRGFDLEGARERAAQLLREGKQNVAIMDSTGHKIFGEDLRACCNRTKTLTPDLRAAST